jgi:hypothetical protein
VLARAAAGAAAGAGPAAAGGAHRETPAAAASLVGMRGCQRLQTAARATAGPRPGAAPPKAPDVVICSPGGRRRAPLPRTSPASRMYLTSRYPTCAWQCMLLLPERPPHAELGRPGQQQAACIGGQRLHAVASPSQASPGEPASSTTTASSGSAPRLHQVACTQMHDCSQHTSGNPVTITR